MLNADAVHITESLLLWTIYLIEDPFLVLRVEPGVGAGMSVLGCAIGINAP